jgi:hypothetical protein
MSMSERTSDMGEAPPGIPGAALPVHLRPITSTKRSCWCTPVDVVASATLVAADSLAKESIAS